MNYRTIYLFLTWLTMVALASPSFGFEKTKMHKLPTASALLAGMEGDTNRPGMDYRNFDAATAQQCQATCNNETQCKSWSWVKSGAQGPNGRCWLKTGAPDVAKNDCCISGVKPEAAPAPFVTHMPNTGTAKTTLSKPGEIIPNIPNTEVNKMKHDMLAPKKEVTNGAMPKIMKPSVEAKTKTLGGNIPAKEVKPKSFAKIQMSAPKKYTNALALHEVKKHTDAVATENKLATSLYNALDITNTVVGDSISKINGVNPKGFIFRPDAVLVIQGGDFGTNGNLRLLGAFRNSPQIQINDWRPNLIYARMPVNMAGEQDMSNLRFEVQPQGKPVIQVQTVSFTAEPTYEPGATSGAAQPGTAGPAPSAAQQQYQTNVTNENLLAETIFKTASIITAGMADGSLPGVFYKINGQSLKGYVFRPDSEVVIQGGGFGKSGKLRLLGGFHNTPGFKITDWRDDVIYARLDGAISGEEDLSDVSLEVQPDGRQPILHSGMRFEAARENVEIKLDYNAKGDGLRNMLDSFTTTYDSDYGFISAELKNFMILERGSFHQYIVRSTKKENWFPPGTDVLHFPLKPSFKINSYNFHEGPTFTDSGKSACTGSSGGTYFQGKYDIQQVDDHTFKVDWGVWRCHDSPTLFSDQTNINVSFYQIFGIEVSGPRGVSPYKN